jgi:hypothetical protein
MLKTSCRYQIDAFDNITAIGGDWFAFAKENGGEALLESSPIGRSIWDFIQGDSIKNLYSLIIKKVRQTGKPVYFPFRCDSPNHLRYMEMVIDLGEGDSIWFETTIIKTLNRSSPTALLLPAETDYSETLLSVCAWCSNVKIQAEWIPLEDAIRILGLFDNANNPLISHGICPDCARKWVGE